MTSGGKRPGAGRKKKADSDLRKNRSIKFSDDEWELLRQAAEKATVSVNKFVRSLAVAQAKGILSGELPPDDSYQ